MKGDHPATKAPDGATKLMERARRRPGGAGFQIAIK
jgi:hypothetical protein